MKELTFTEQEKKDLKKSLDVIIDDMRELWKVSSLKEIIIPFDLLNIGKKDWALQITSEEIRFFQAKYEEDYNSRYTKKVIELQYFDHKSTIDYILGRCSFIRNTIEDENINYIFRFMTKYEEIRKEVEAQIKEALQEKQQSTEIIETIKDKYSKETTIEIEFPQIQNVPTIEVKQTDGKTVGEIRMGSGTFRIITKGNIVLVNEKEQEKVKSIKKGG